jgi:erythronate-4-phosphate dehydrogenase
VFLNTARGGVVDSGALKAAMKAGKFGAVVLDVWEDEPNIDAELLEMVDIGTPHIAGHSLDGKVAGMIMIYRSACEYFGVGAEFDFGSFLAGPVTAQLNVNPKSGENEQEMLRQVVNKIYDIKKDDADLRWMLDRPQGKRGGFFENLREDYPVRREFQNTQIVLENPCESLAAKLVGIGFKEGKSKKAKIKNEKP